MYSLAAWVAAHFGVVHLHCLKCLSFVRSLLSPRSVQGKNDPLFACEELGGGKKELTPAWSSTFLAFEASHREVPFWFARGCVFLVNDTRFFFCEVNHFRFRAEFIGAVMCFSCNRCRACTEASIHRFKASCFREAVEL